MRLPVATSKATMKATLEFNLPDDELAHRLAVRSWDMASEVQIAWAKMRTWKKHGHTFDSPEAAIEGCMELIAEAHSIAFEP